MLEAGRSRVRFLMGLLDFLIDLILPASQWPWDRLSLLTEMSTKDLPGGKGQPAREADNLIAVYEPFVYKMWEPRRLCGPELEHMFSSLWGGGFLVSRCCSVCVVMRHCLSASAPFFPD
jgi:hypothetical protein